MRKEENQELFDFFYQNNKEIVNKKNKERNFLKIASFLIY